jgi:release factor glutamine methyltransferase
MIWTLMNALQWSADFLKTKGSETPRVDAEWLLSSVLGFQRVELYTNFDRPLNDVEREKYRNFIRRRALGEPVAYILGEKAFAGLDFQVSPSVLIPRPETELLVEHVTRAIQSALSEDPNRKIRILDAGTGSGCVAISVAKWWLEKVVPTGQTSSGASLLVDAWDVSEDALAVAATNSRRHGTGDLVRFIKSDMLDPDSYSKADSWDFIVSNPPYIGDAEFSQLSPGVKDFEPRLALWGYPDGLYFYQQLAQFARRSMAEQGKLFLEIGCQQGDSVKRLLESNGWASVRVELDYARHPRNVIAVNPR